MEQLWPKGTVTVDFGEKRGAATVRLRLGETEGEQERERCRIQLSRAIFLKDLDGKHQ